MTSAKVETGPATEGLITEGPVSETTVDHFFEGRLQLVQPKTGYRIAIDPLLLAAAVDVPEGARVLDVGCGTGAALLSLLTRREDVQGVGLERHVPFLELARHSITLNGFSDRASLIQGDLACPSAALLTSGYDAVMTNPPFFEAGTVPDRPDVDSPHAVTELPLVIWVHKCLNLLVTGGLFAIIHRAERVAEIIQALKGCGSVTVIPLWPKADRPASRVIVTALKDRKSPAVIHPGLILHQNDGTYTEAAAAILRYGYALDSLT
ncbi:MAG: methyltransferase [Rhodospirillaceae bacterium]